MRTRTLLLLAIGCGFVILAAGVVQLLRIAGQDEAPTAALVGEPTRVADMTITVETFDEVAEVADVVVAIGGVDDPDGSDAFRLVVPGRALVPAGGTADACGATAVEPVVCHLSFDVGEVDGSARVLLYRRGDEQARWELDGP